MSRSTARPPAKVSARAVAVGLALGAVAAAMSALLAGTPFVAGVESRSYDFRVRRGARPAGADSSIVIVEINESSLRRMESVVGRWPWPRMVHASAVDFLERAGAKVIAYDVLFGEREGRSETTINGRAISGEESDQAFVRSVREASNVVLLADAIYEGQASGTPMVPAAPLELPSTVYRPGPGFQHRPFLSLPFGDLTRAAVGIGHNRLEKDDRSDSARRMLPFIESQGVAVPSLGMAAALRFLGAEADEVRLDGGDLLIGPARMPLLHQPVPSGDPSAQALIRFVKPVPDKAGVLAAFPTYSFFDVLVSEDNVAGGRDPIVPLEAFKGKLVFIGTTAAGLFDRYATPFPGGAAGVELHAMLADNVLSGTFMRRAAGPVDLVSALGAGIAAGVAATTLPVALACLATLALAGVIVAWHTYEVGAGLWLGSVMPLSAAALALFGGVAWRYFVEDRAKRHVRSLFGRYVSNDVIEQLMADPSRLALGGQRRDMTVLFSDIRGFTTASERAAPEAVVAQLNEYFGAMVEVLFRHRGTLDKFVGDMVMGLFGAPLDDDRHADHAVEAALEMSRRLDELNEKWRREGKPELNIGIGVNSGDMIAGNIGSEAIMSYTVIGDAVNLGSRLESLNKEYGTRILVSDATRARLTRPFDLERIGAVTVKGRTQAVDVYSVKGVKGVKDMKEGA